VSGPACPRCRRPLEAARDDCPGCGRDVTALRRVSDLADRSFNRGLRAARARDWHEAGEALAVTLALRPDDVEATALAARVARRQGRADRSRELAERVVLLDPARPGVADAVAPVPGPAVTGLATGLWWFGRAVRGRRERGRG
jgi:hypothetical protein